MVSRVTGQGLGRGRLGTGIEMICRNDYAPGPSTTLDPLKPHLLIMCGLALQNTTYGYWVECFPHSAPHHRRLRTINIPRIPKKDAHATVGILHTYVALLDP